MSSVDATKAAITTYLNTPAGAKIAKHAEIHPDLPMMLMAVAAQSVNLEMGEILNTILNTEGTAKGKSLSGTGPEEEEREPNVLTGEASYTRPNGELYYARKWGQHQDVMVLRKSRDTGKFVFLYGAPGCGKTALAEGAFGEDLITVVGSGDTRVGDLVGGYVQTASGIFEWVNGPLLVAALEGRPFLLDEIGLVDTKELTPLYGLMDGRREIIVTANPELGVIKAAPGFFVVGATNPDAPGVVLSEALLSRFSVHVEMTTDWKLAKRLKVNEDMVTVAKNLDAKRKADEITWAPQFRELIAFRDLEETFGQDWAIANLLAICPPIDRDRVLDVIKRTFGDDMAHPAVI